MTEYVGIRFVDGGREATGCDCWGLVRMFLEQECGIQGLPTYGETPASDLAGAETAVAEAVTPGGLWQAVPREDLRRGDVVVMHGFERVKGRPVKTLRHVGVMVDRRRVLHVEIETDSVIVPLSDPSIRHRLHSFYRHRDLA